MEIGLKTADKQQLIINWIPQLSNVFAKNKLPDLAQHCSGESHIACIYQ